jgi:hypothetical protein
MMSILIPLGILGIPLLGVVPVATGQTDAEPFTQDRSQSPEKSEVPPPTAVELDWQSRCFDSLQDVEAWLDHLESEGVADRDLHLRDDGQFLVRWR